jgi:hypothetical protein
MSDPRAERQKRWLAPGGGPPGLPADAPAPRPEPQLRTVPVTRGGLPPRDVFAKPNDTRLPFGAAGRCTVALDCSRHGGGFLAGFRQNRVSKAWYSAGVAPTGSWGSGEPGDKQTYSLAELPFDKVWCPFCRSSMPVLCGQFGRLYCRGDVDEESQRFRCRCGYEGPISPTLRTVDGFEHQAPQPGALLFGPERASAAARALADLITKTSEVGDA